MVHHRKIIICALGVALVGCGGGFAPNQSTLPTSEAVELSSPDISEAHVRSWGEGQTIVMIHGLGENAGTDFDPLRAQLETRFRVFAPDLPGFGETPRGELDTRPETYADYVATWMRANLQGPVIVLGHSMGGAVAIALAARHPELVSQLLLLDVAGILHREAYTTSQLLPAVEENAGGFLAGAANAVLGATRVLEPSEEMLRSSTSGSPSSAAAVGLILADLGPALSEVRAPTSILWGAEDTVAPVRTSHVLKQRLHAEVQLLDGVGHVPMSEATDYTVEFITRVSASSGAPGSAGANSGAEARPVPRPAEPFVCDGRRERVELTQDASSVRVRNCSDVHIIGAEIGHLDAQDSTVTLVDTRVSARTGPGANLAVVELRDSEFTMSGGSVQGNVTFAVHHARLDVAGAEIIANQTAFLVDDKSRALLSVVKVSENGRVVHTHGVVDLQN